MNPFLTISIATRNRPEYLEKLITSIANSKKNTSERIEIDVIVDGLDQAATVAYLEKVNLDNLRFFTIPWQGVAGARNFGSKVARGEFIRFQDDDDTLDSSAIIEIIQFHKRHPDSFLLGHAILRDTKNKFMNWATGANGFLYSYTFMKSIPLSHWGRFWGGRISLPKRYLNDCKFDTTFDFMGEDTEWAFRFAQNNKLDIHHGKKVISVVERSLTIDEAVLRTVTQGWSNYKISEMHKQSHLEEVLRSNCATFADKQKNQILDEIALLLKHPFCRDVNFLEISQNLDLCKYEVESFLHGIWWRVIELCKSLGYLAAQDGLSRMELEELVRSSIELFPNEIVKN